MQYRTATTRAVQVRDEDGRKGAFPPPGRRCGKENFYLILGFRRNPLIAIAAPANAAAM